MYRRKVQLLLMISLMKHIFKALLLGKLLRHSSKLGIL